MNSAPSISFRPAVLRLALFATALALPRPAAAADPIAGDWSTQANGYRGRNGERFTYTFPAGSPTGRLWGSGPYTDDSSIATAAVHAGLITPATGGTVTIEIRGGESSYAGTTQNGLPSQGYGAWSGSFVFVNAPQGTTGTTSVSGTPPPPANSVRFHVVNYVGDVPNRHDFAVHFERGTVREFNQESTEGTEEIQVKTCRANQRLTMRTNFRKSGYWIEYDLVFLDDGRTVAGSYRDPGSCGPSIGARAP